MKKLLLSLGAVLILFGIIHAQAISLDVVTKMNTTDPPNLSWVVGDYEVVGMSDGTARLRPIDQPLMPEFISVNYQDQILSIWPEFAKGNKVTLVIREAWVSQVFSK